MRNKTTGKITKQTPLKSVLAIGQECNNNQDKCRNCCGFSAGIVLEEDINRLAKHFGISKEEAKKKYLEEKTIFNKKLHSIKTLKEQNKPYGRCIFFAPEKGCEIHGIKPLHCKIANCNEHGEVLHQWFLLNYVIDADDPESLRQWDTYATTSQNIIPGGTVQEIIPDKEKLAKILNYELLSRDDFSEAHDYAEKVKQNRSSKEKLFAQKFSQKSGGKSKK